MEPPSRPPKVGWLQTVASVLSSFFGVQSSRNRARDFQGGSPLRFIVVGLALTLGFILAVWLAVRVVLHNAGM